jgi:peptide/nickel transport system substrate-binding protein
VTVLGWQSYPPTLDPAESYYTYSVAMESALLFRSLTQYDYDPRTHRSTLVPDLATTLGTHNSDYTVWRFTLRKGIRFDNGRPVTADDVRFGIERSFDRAAFPDGPTTSNAYFLDGNTYQGPYRTPGRYPGIGVSGRTLTLRMARPFPDLPYYLAEPVMGPVPPGSVSNPATYRDHPWATGPYRIQHYVPGHSLVLVRNRYWNPATDAVRHAYVDRYVFDFRGAADPNPQADRRMLDDVGRARTSILWSQVSPQVYPAFRREAPQRLLHTVDDCTWFLVPDFRKTDLAVRRALAYAYPYRAIWHARGLIPAVTVTPATNMMAPATSRWVRYNPLPGHVPGTTNAARARAILTRASQLHFPIRFAFITDQPPSGKVTSIMVRAFRHAGFAATRVRSTSATYADDVLNNPRAPVNLRMVGWCADWPTGGSWVPQLFSPGVPNGTQAGDYAYFPSALTNARVNAILRLPLARQPAAWSAFERQVERKYLVLIPTAYPANTMTRGSQIHGAFLDPVYGNPTYQDIWVG